MLTPHVLLIGMLLLLGSCRMSAAQSEVVDPFEFEAEATGVTLRSRPISEVPASMTVISREDLRDFGFQSLAEALTLVRGVFISTDHNYHYAGMRGYSPLGDWGTHLLVMIDGFPLIGGFYLNAPLGSDFPVEMNAIERIEVVRGPGSALFGSNALLGVINVVTRRGSARTGGSVEVRASSSRQVCAATDVGGTISGGWNWFVSGSGFGGPGPDYPVNNPIDDPRMAFGADGDRGGRFFASMARSDWSFQAALGSRTKEVPTGAWSTEPGDDRSQTRDDWGLASAEFLHAFGTTSAVQARLSMGRDHYEGDYFSLDEMTGLPARLSQDESTSGSAELDFRVILEPLASMGATIGVARREHLKARASSWLLEPYELVGEVDQPWHQQSAYAQLDWIPSRQLSVQAGLRLDDATIGGTVVNPRIGANWHPARDWTVRALAGRAYRRPNLYETYFTDGLTSRGNSDLRSEILWTKEVGAEYRRGGVTAALTTFENSFDDRIVVNVDPADSLLQYINAGQLRISGIEAELSGNLGRGVRWRGSWTYASHGEVDGDAVSMVNFAGHVGQASLVFPVPGASGRMAVCFHAVGPRQSANGDRVPGYGLTDLTWSTEPLPGRLETAVRVSNVLDQSWNDPGGEEHVTSRIPGWGRTVDLLVRVGF